MPSFSPAYDNKITRKYSARTIEHKGENKTALQEELGWINEPKQPIVCFPTGITDALGGALLEEVLPGILELQVSVVIRGRGSKKYGELFTKLSKAHGHRVAIVPDDETHMRKILAGSDMALFFADQNKEELENALRYGAIPIAPPSPLLDNYNPVQESGNAFIYQESTMWQCFGSLVRALETFKFPYDWRTIQRHAMESIDRNETANITE
jgi:glycogen synthase